MTSPSVDTGSPLERIDAGRSLAEHAADRIRERVVRGGFTQGQHLAETKIADELGISRGPVREAFMMLRAEGVLTEEPRRGTFVVTITPQDVREIYGLRAAIEGAAVKQLSRQADPAVLAKLDAALDKLAKASARGKSDDVARADVAFHELLCRLSGNARLHQTFLRYVPVLRGLVRFDDEVMPPDDGVVDQHRPLVDAIRSGDEDTAVRLIVEHSEQAGELLARLLERGAPA